MKFKGPAAKQDATALTCSICGRGFYLHETNVPPFCSERCKLIDLGRWLDEDIGVPHEGGPMNGEHSETEPNGDEGGH